MIIDDLPVEIDRETLLKLAGYSDKRPAPRRLMEAAERVIELARALAHPRAVYEVHETSQSDDGAVLLGGGYLGEGVRLERRAPPPGLEPAVCFVLRLDAPGPRGALPGATSGRRTFEVHGKVAPDAAPGDVLRMLAAMATALAALPEAG